MYLSCYIYISLIICVLPSILSIIYTIPKAPKLSSDDFNSKLNKLFHFKKSSREIIINQIFPIPKSLKEKESNLIPLKSSKEKESDQIPLKSSEEKKSNQKFNPDVQHLRIIYAKLLICAYKYKATNSLIKLLTGLSDDEIDSIRTETLVQFNENSLNIDDPEYNIKKDRIQKDRLLCSQKCYALSLLRKNIKKDIYQIISETSYYEDYDDEDSRCADMEAGCIQHSQLPKLIVVKPSFLKKYLKLFSSSGQDLKFSISGQDQDLKFNAKIALQEYFILYVMPYLNNIELKMSTFAITYPDLIASNLGNEQYLETAPMHIDVAAPVELGRIQPSSLISNIKI